MAKLWGAENPAFMHHGGVGVAGYATHGVASYTWWHHLLTGFVVPNSAWIGKVISVSEFTIGVALVLGVLTPLFAVAGLTLNMIYMFSGTAGVNPMFAILSVVLILAWRTSGWIGADGLLMAAWQRRRHATGSTPVTGGADAPPLQPVTDARRPVPTVAPPTLAPS
jgi:thiosulfate dehydrogenase [quinone] large subunit